jgi:hypothetical protein
MISNELHFKSEKISTQIIGLGHFRHNSVILYKEHFFISPSSNNINIWDLKNKVI